MMRRRLKENGSATRSSDDCSHLGCHLRELCRSSRRDDDDHLPPS